MSNVTEMRRHGTGLLAGVIGRRDVDPADVAKTVRQLRKLATLMDSAFRVPFTTRRVGFDSLLGLIPGVGDVATAAISAIIVGKAIRLGIPPRTVARMVSNLGADMLLGSVPVVGDLFDFAFKANLKNVELLEKELGLLRTGPDTPSADVPVGD